MTSRPAASEGAPRTTLLASPRLLPILVLAVGLPSYASLIVMGLMTERLAFPSGGILGGDHTAIWTAARGVWNGDYPGLYDAAAFEAALQRLGTPEERFGLTWQYPPHAMLVLAPFGLLPYLVSYAVFALGGLAAFAVSLRRGAGATWRTALLVLAAPVLFQAVVCGQTGAFVGALMIGALVMPDRRPLIAGLCAGLLTVKPQLGVLIPVAYLAGGHGRAFAVAAATTLALVGGSLVLFGAEAWALFLGQILGVTEMVGDAVYPLHKMVTVFAAARTLGLPEAVAAALQILAALTACVLCWRLWRGQRPITERAALTAGLAFLCTPYAYHYDASVLALPYLLAARGVSIETPGRLAALAACFMTPMWMTGAFSAVGAQLGLGAVLLVTLLAARPDLLSRRVPLGSPAAA